MTTTTHQGSRETIRQFLDRGGNPADHPEAEMLVEAVIWHRRVDREHHTGFNRDWLRAMAAHGVDALPPMAVPEPLEKRKAKLEDVRWRTQLALELLQDDELADRFERGLPADVVAEELAGVEKLYDIRARPYRIERREMEGLHRCVLTGDEIEGPALVLVDRNEEKDDIVMSPAAVRAVLDRGMDASRSGQ